MDDNKLELEARTKIAKEDLALLEKQIADAEERRLYAESAANTAESRALTVTAGTAKLTTQVQLIAENDRKIESQTAIIAEARQRAEKAQDEMFNAERSRDSRVKEIRELVAVEELRLSSVRSSNAQEVSRHEETIRNLESTITSLKHQKIVETGKVQTLQKAAEQHAARAQEAQERASNATSEWNRVMGLVGTKREEIARADEAHKKAVTAREESVISREAAVSIKEVALKERQKFLMNARSQLEKIHGKPIKMTFPD